MQITPRMLRMLAFCCEGERDICRSLIENEEGQPDGPQDADGYENLEERRDDAERMRREFAHLADGIDTLQKGARPAVVEFVIRVRK